MPTDIAFEVDDDDTLTVTIDTDNLRMDSVQKKDAEDYYHGMYNDSEVMAKYGEGTTKDFSYVEKRVTTWVERWENNNPFSALKITNKEDECTAGNVMFSQGETLGSAELSSILKKKYWKKGLGSEVAHTIIQEYAPELVKRGYKINNQTFTDIVATSHPDNIATIRILEKNGMTKGKEEERYGHLRYFYSKEVTFSK